MDLSRLLRVIEVDQVDDDAFVGHSPQERSRAVYGGQFLAQALMAASATVEAGRVPHSLHAYFVRSGAALQPIDYRVERIRDGRSFSHRSVVASQDGREVFRQVQSFQVPADGLRHQEPIDIEQDVDPSTMTPYRDWVREYSDNQDHEWFAEHLPVDIRFQDAPLPESRAPFGGIVRIWMKLLGEVPTSEPTTHAALLAWMSDKTISDMTMYPHGRTWTDTGYDILSLDHAMHFFEPSRADRWTLLTHETPATGGGRGLARGDLVTLDGRRVGSVVQEALLVTPDEPDSLEGRPVTGAS